MDQRRHRMSLKQRQRNGDVVNMRFVNGEWGFVWYIPRKCSKCLFDLEMTVWRGWYVKPCKSKEKVTFCQELAGSGWGRAGEPVWCPNGLGNPNLAGKQANLRSKRARNRLLSRGQFPVRILGFLRKNDVLKCVPDLSWAKNTNCT